MTSEEKKAVFDLFRHGIASAMTDASRAEPGDEVAMKRFLSAVDSARDAVVKALAPNLAPLAEAPATAAAASVPGTTLTAAEADLFERQGIGKGEFVGVRSEAEARKIDKARRARA